MVPGRRTDRLLLRRQEKPRHLRGQRQGRSSPPVHHASGARHQPGMVQGWPLDLLHLGPRRARPKGMEGACKRRRRCSRPGPCWRSGGVFRREVSVFWPGLAGPVQHLEVSGRWRRSGPRRRFDPPHGRMESVGRRRILRRVAKRRRYQPDPVQERHYRQGRNSRYYARAPVLGFAVSPDRRTILYVQYDEAGSDLMLVENFR